MPYKDPEKRNEHFRERRKNDPAWHEKQKQYFKDYYVLHRRKLLSRQKEYQERVGQDPSVRAARRRAYRKHYYARVSKTEKYNARMRSYNKEYRAKLRNKVLDAYGPICSCCGETIREFLTPDHINGGGSEHLRRRGTVGIYRDIIKEGFPKNKYRILCMNCNWARSVYGKCPHERRGKH